VTLIIRYSEYIMTPFPFPDASRALESLNKNPYTAEEQVAWKA